MRYRMGAFINLDPEEIVMYGKLLAALISTALLACLGAGAASAAMYESVEESYGTSFQAKSKAASFTFNGQTVECAKVVLKGITPGAQGSTTLKVTPKYEECKFGKTAATVTNENCEYELERPLESKTNVYLAAYNMVTGAGKGSCALVIKPLAECEIFTGAQKQLKAIQLKDGPVELEEKGSAQTAEVTNLTYTAKGAACAVSGIKSGSAGEYKNLTPPPNLPPRAVNVDLQFKSVPFNMLRTFEGPSVTGVDQVFEFATRTITCLKAKWKGAQRGGSFTLAVEPLFEECETEGVEVTQIVTPPCSFLLENPRASTAAGTRAILSRMRVFGTGCPFTFRFPIENVMCEIMVIAQGPIGAVAVEYSNVVSTHELEVEPVMRTLEYKVPNGNCTVPGVGAFSNGKYKGALKLENMEIS